MTYWDRYEVIVLGGGHAGTEAACAAARLGARTVLVTTSLETIGQMSCNPAIGGVAKGTVVREVDAMGGIMGRAADRATLHFRMLNKAKGPAVWSPRAQCDRGLYRRAVRSLLEGLDSLEFLQGTVTELVIAGDRVAGVRLADGRALQGRAVVLTAGTFLRGRIHIGTETQLEGGRAGDHAAHELAQAIANKGVKVGRFKTGTPPRIDGRSVDWSCLERQDGSDDDYRFSYFDRSERPARRPCWITWAGEDAREIIANSLSQSALYGGAISSRGPRYCPSVEDKVVKFPNAERHQIFLEPEGLETSELYVNGLSTSLPVDVQLRVLRSIPGLHRVKMTRPGYAIEYDYYPPTQLTPWLEFKTIEGLFHAGQVNGTTGYEEAAGQGLMGGINAARRVRGQEPVVLGRADAYVGVLIDDLVTRGVDEPYRLFTSRAEFRLLLRQDNALQRLAPLAERLGLLREDELRIVESRFKMEERCLRWAEETVVRPGDVATVLDGSGQSISQSCRVADVVRRPRVSLSAIWSAHGLDAGDRMTAEALEAVEIRLRYSGYIAREREAVERLREMADFRLPVDLEYATMHGLSTEARQKLAHVRPNTLAQAGRVPGVSPSDLQNLVVAVTKLRRAS